MITYDPKSYTDVLFRLRGSVLPSIISKVCAVFVVEVIAVVWTRNSEYLQEHPIPDDGHKIFGFLVGFLLVFRSTIAHKRYTDGVAKLTALENHSIELIRKVALYCSPGSGSWGSTKDGVFDTEGATKLRAVRDLIRRLTVQLVVLIGTDIQIDISALGSKPRRLLKAATSHPEPQQDEALWHEIAATSALFTAEELNTYRKAGGHYVALAARNIENSLFPLFKGHFPHVNFYRECLSHVKELTSVWSACIVTARTPIPFPFVHLSKLFTFIFLYTLPFALAADLGWLTVAAVFTLALGYFGLDAIATEMEQPFGTDLNDLPVAATVERIEKSTRVIMSQLEGEDLVAYTTRPFFVSG